MDSYTISMHTEKETMPLELQGLIADQQENSISPRMFAQAIRVLRINSRQGTVGVKSRSDVAFSNKKPWRQKGTGRARCGTRRSPLWRKGGVTFGPQPRTRKLDMNRKQKRSVLKAIFLDYVQKGNIHALSFQEKADFIKTKHAQLLLKNAGLAESKLLLFLDRSDVHMLYGVRNLPYVSVVFFDEPNAYDFAHATSWAFMEKDIEAFKQMVSAWN